MLYNGENPILRIVGVEHMRWSGGVFQVKAREYSGLAFRISGTATITANGKEHFVDPGDILYLPQNMAYTAEYTDTELLVIHFVALKSDEDAEVYSVGDTEQMHRLFLSALGFWRSKEPGFQMYALSQLYKILGAMLENSTKTALPAHFLEAVSFINSAYKDSSLSIHMICERAGISATVLRQLFKMHYQKTPVEYITDLRLESARSLISAGTSVEQAAYESGFNDSKYFARVVKKHFGCTPRELKIYGK